MPGFQITITDAGRAEIINAQNTGATPVEIAEIGVGTGSYEPSPTQTALQDEVKRLTTFSGDAVADDTLHVSVRDDTTDVYQVYEFGLYLGSGTLFAVYSQTGSPILDKTAQTILLLAVDIILTSDLQASSFTFGSTDFMNPYATDETPGVVELATDTEAQAKSDATRALVPANLAALGATDTFAGLIARATTAEAEDGTDGNKAMSPARVHEAFKQFGLGYWTPISDANNAAKSGLYSLPEYLGAANSPVANESGALLVINGGSDSDYVSQIWIEANDTGSQRMFMRRYSGTMGTWSDWVELMTSENTGTAAARDVGTDSDQLPSTADADDRYLRQSQNLSDLPDKSLSRQNLGLLSGATTAKQTSTTDSTAGALMINGAWGLGGTGEEIADADTALSSGLYSLPAASSNGPVSSTSGTLLVVAGGSGEGYVTQLWTRSNDSDLHEQYIRHRKGANGWTAWQSAGGLDQRAAMTGGGTLTPGAQHHLVDSNTYTLPDPSSLSPGTSVVVSKSIYAEPAIDTTGAESIVTDAGTVASITLTADTECVFIWNNTNWEMVAGDPAAGFTQALNGNGWQKFPSGLIIQWGYSASPNDGKLISLPVTYPNEHLCASGSDRATGVSSTTSTGVEIIDSSTISVSNENENSGMFWISFGH